MASPKRQRGQITQSEAQAKFKVSDTDFVVMRSRGLRPTGRVALGNGRSVPLFKDGDVRAAARLVKNREMTITEVAAATGASRTSINTYIKLGYVDVIVAERPNGQELHLFDEGAIAQVRALYKRGSSPRPTTPDSLDFPTIRKGDPRTRSSGAPSNGIIAVLGDTHVPYDDKDAMGAFTSWAQAQHPAEIIHLGDLGDWESTSMHQGATPRILEDDVRACHKFLRGLTKLAPKVALRQGNHDIWGQRAIQAKLPGMAGVYDVARELDLSGLGIEWSPEGPKSLRRGTAKLLHGHEFMPRRFASPPKYHSRRALDVYGEPGTTIVYGHVHRRQMFQQAYDTGNCVAMSIPCMRLLQPPWLGPEVAGWEHGFAVLYLEEGRPTEVEVVVIDRGAFWWGGKRWSC